MEVLNSIWNVLTTENEMLTKIVTAPTVVIEAWIIFKLTTLILNIEYSQKQKKLFILLLSINSLLIEFVIPSPFNIFINYLVMFIIVKMVLHTNIIKSIFSIVLSFSVFALVGNLILNPILKLLSITSVQLASSPIYRLIYLFILYSIDYLIILILTKRKLTFNILSTLDTNSKRLFLLNLFMGILTIAIQLIITFYYINIYTISFSLLNFVSLLAYFLVSFYSLKRIMKLQITTIELKNAESYNNTLSILYDNVKAFKHDFDNMVFTIGGFINNNDLTGLKKYYSSLEKDCQKVNNIALLNPTLINNPGIYNLLTVKYQKAQVQNIEIQLDFFFDLNKLHMPIYDFSRMLGIFLDNAIEAAALSINKVIKIVFRDSSNSNVQIIQIENSYSNKNIDIKTIFKKGITEKENHLGMGLWEVKQILKRNNNVNLITNRNDLYFKQCLEIYY